MADPMSHSERARRRQEIAEAVRNGADPIQLSQQHGVSLPMVHAACRNHGVKIIPTVEQREAPLISYHSGRVRTLQIIAELQNTADTQEAIGARLGITKQAINGVLVSAVERGIKFPHRGHP